MFNEYSTDQILETLRLDHTDQDHTDDFYASLAEARQTLQGFNLQDYLGNMEASYV